jgi:hypothetical protein
LLIAYDAEDPSVRRAVDRIQRRDRWGLIVPFPFQNPELARVALELAGRPLHLEMHGLDTATRKVWAGKALLPHLLKRLPRWRWVAPLLHVPVLGLWCGGPTSR